MAEFDTELCEGCKRIDNETTAIAGVMVTLVGIGIRLDRAVDADRVCQLPTTEVVGLSVDSPSAVESTEAQKSPFRFSVPDGSAH